MNLKLYPLMSKITRRRFRQRRYKYGKEVPYRPHTRLVKNLQAKVGLPQEEIMNQLYKEREYLLSRLK